ncbi:hypothetical protein RUM44_002107 [Polyplax serrata]|uniref:Uncharacterized protein n=1 Tax=Polyplax serrata TaxID=468196 RepID=A0ABR1AM17_POLSC
MKAKSQVFFFFNGTPLAKPAARAKSFAAIKAPKGDRVPRVQEILKKPLRTPDPLICHGKMKIFKELTYSRKQSKGKCFTKWGWMKATSRDDTKNEEEVRSGSVGRMMKGTLTVTKRD